MQTTPIIRSANAGRGYHKSINGLRGNPKLSVPYPRRSRGACGLRKPRRAQACSTAILPAALRFLPQPSLHQAYI
jgi:hypothetical protein